MHKYILGYFVCSDLEELYSIFFLTITANILHQGINVVGIFPALVLKN